MEFPGDIPLVFVCHCRVFECYESSLNIEMKVYERNKPKQAARGSCQRKTNEDRKICLGHKNVIIMLKVTVVASQEVWDRRPARLGSSLCGCLGLVLWQTFVHLSHQTVWKCVEAFMRQIAVQ